MSNKALETLEFFEDIDNLAHSKIYNTREFALNGLIEFYRLNKWFLTNPLDTDKIDLMEADVRKSHFDNFVKYCVILSYQLIIENKIITNNEISNNLINYIVYKALSKFEDSYFKSINLHGTHGHMYTNDLINISVKTLQCFFNTAYHLNLFIHDSKDIFVDKCLQDQKKFI